MGFFKNKDGIIGAALGASGAFDKDKKIDKDKALRTAIGTSIGSGEKWTLSDSLRLDATINVLDSMKDIPDNNYGNSGISSSGSTNKYDNLFLDSEQEERLEEAGIDSFEFDMMDDDEKIEALEDVGLDPFDFDMF